MINKTLYQKKVRGTKTAPQDSVKNQVQDTNSAKHSYQLGLTNCSKSIILTRKEVQTLLINSIKSLSIKVVSEENRIGNILKKNRRIIGNRLIKSSSK